MAGFSQKDESFRQYALTASPMRVLLKVCMPLALYQELTHVFKILDTLMASRISASAVSAVACLSQITLMITALGSGLAIGGSIKVSEAYGRGDDVLVQHLVATIYAMTIAVSLLIAALLIPFAAPFLRLLRTPEDLIATGLSYFRIEIVTLMVTFFNTVYIAIERSRGHARKILILNMAMIAVKLSLSALFVYVLNGGLIQIASASLTGQCLILGYALLTMPRDQGAFRFRFSAIRMKKEITLPVLDLAYPVAGEKMFFAAGKVVTNSMAAVYGSLTVGALGISNNIGGLTTSWQQGFTDGCAPLISQNRGARKYRRTLQLFWQAMIVCLVIGVAGMAVVYLSLPWLANVFANSRETLDPEFRDLIVTIHGWEMMGYITLGINSAVTSLLLGYGYTRLSLVLNFARMFVYRVPMLWALQHFTSLGSEAVGITMMFSNVCIGLTSAIAAIPIIRRIRRLIAEEENAKNNM